MPIPRSRRPASIALGSFSLFPGRDTLKVSPSLRMGWGEVRGWTPAGFDCPAVLEGQAQTVS